MFRIEVSLTPKNKHYKVLGVDRQIVFFYPILSRSHRKMKFSISVLSLLGGLASIASAATTCTPSPKVTPKTQYEFSMNLTLGAGTSIGLNIDNSRQTYLPIIGGSFCAKWNGGVTGTVVVSSASLGRH